MAAVEKALWQGDCPRCGQPRTTFDLLAEKQITFGTYAEFEVFACCRMCFRSSVAHLSQDSVSAENPLKNKGHFINYDFKLLKWVFTPPGVRKIPEHAPAEVSRIFNEAALCLAVQAWDAAGTMFRKVLDASTRSITPSPDAETTPRTPNWKTYKDLRLRLTWLFENNLLHPALKASSSCIHEDGNDAAHALEGIGKAEAEDLADFAEDVLQTIYTVPGQIAANEERRKQRRLKAG